jgi:hypothetical protein
MSRTPQLLPGQRGSSDSAAVREQREREHARTRSFAAQAAPPQPLAGAALQRALGLGRPLAPQVRAEMESRFGAHFGDVRVHDTPAAQALARQQRAQAFTLGNDIAFGGDRDGPETTRGRRLLAHELAHVVQQRRGGTELPTPGGPLEQAAERASAQLISGSGPVAVEGAGAVAVARQPLPEDEMLDLPPPPRSLSESVAKNEKDLSDTALDLEMSRIEDFVQALPMVPEREHLLSEYRLMFDERVARRKRKESPMPLQYRPKDVKRDIEDAHRAFGLTGQIPQTQYPHSLAEIKLGKPMSRRERYDLMMELQGRKHPLEMDVRQDLRDPEILGKEEFEQEYRSRIAAEKDACDDEYFWPKYERQCKERVNEKYGGPGYVEWRDANYRRAYAHLVEVSAKIDAVKYGGPFSLVGRVAGYGFGVLTGRDPLKTSEDWATVAAIGDAAVAYRSMKTARMRVQNYTSSGGLSVGRDADIHLMQPRSYGVIPTPSKPVPPQSTPGGSPRQPAAQSPFSSTSTGSPFAGASTQTSSLPAPIPISSGKGLPQSDASKALASNLAKQSPGKAGSITPLPVRKPDVSPKTEPAQQKIPAVAAVEDKIAVGQTHGAGGAVATSVKPTTSVAGAGAQSAVASLKTPTKSSKASGTGSVKSSIAFPSKSKGTTSSAKAKAAPPAKLPVKTGAKKTPPPVPVNASGGRGTIAERLAALEVPADQRAGFTTASAEVHKLAKKNPARAERLLEALEQRFAPKDRVAQVAEKFEEAQGKMYPEKASRNVYRQSPAADDRQRVEQRDPSAKDVLKAKVRDSERLGVLGGRAQAKDEGINVRKWEPPQQYKGEFGVGPDDLGKRGDKRLILEYKGGDSPLGRSSGVVEMSNVWAGRKIAEIEMVGDKALAKELLAATRNGDLQGAVYRTRGPTGAETTVRLRASQLRDALRDESITKEGLIEYAPSKVLRAYEARKAQLQQAIDRGDLEALKSL